VDIALPEAEAGAAAGRGTTRPWLARHPGPLVLAAYLAAAVALTWRLWAGLGTMSVLGDPGPADNDLMAWFLRYAADALAHGHLPALVSTGLNAPRGFPLMWNNSVLFPAMLVAPVTLLDGPLAGLTVLITLGYAGSAAAMYWLLRRYGASLVPAVLGGAVFGFSPGMVNAGVGHYGMQFAVLTPLMVEAVAAILTSRGRPLWAGARLGVLASAELFTGEEMLTDVAFTCLTLLFVLTLSRPRAIRPRLGGAVAGLGTGAVVALALSAYGLWRQFHGPLTEHGTPWKIAKHGNSFSAFVTPQSQLLFHTPASAAYANGHQALSSEYLAYLGWPMIIIVTLATLWFWRDLRVRCAGVTWVVLEALSLGVTSPLMPYHWLQHLPLLSDTFPSRMSTLADGAAAAVLAFGLDAARRPRGPRAAVLAVITLIAVLPLVPRPMAAMPGAKVPAGWGAVFTRLHLPAKASVMAVPLPYSQQGEAMLWQADTGQPTDLVAGWFLGPNASGEGFDAYWGPKFTSDTAECLNTLSKGPARVPGCAEAIRSSIGYWHPSAVVADTSPGAPLGQFLIQTLGQPAIQDGQVLAWRTGLSLGLAAGLVPGQLDLGVERPVVTPRDAVHGVVAHRAVGSHQDMVQGQHGPPARDAPGGRQRVPGLLGGVRVAEPQHLAERDVVQGCVEVAGQHPRAGARRGQHCELGPPPARGPAAQRGGRGRVDADQLHLFPAGQLDPGGRLGHVHRGHGRPLAERVARVDAGAARAAAQVELGVGHQLIQAVLLQQVHRVRGELLQEQHVGVGLADPGDDRLGVGPAEVHVKADQPEHRAAGRRLAPRDPAPAHQQPERHRGDRSRGGRPPLAGQAYAQGGPRRGLGDLRGERQQRHYRVLGALDPVGCGKPGRAPYGQPARHRPGEGSDLQSRACHDDSL
jgi:hypothetical protein